MDGRANCAWVLLFALSQTIHAEAVDARVSDLRFTHLTTTHGLALDNVVSILQDQRGFMWFGTGDGLSRYDGNSFITFKNNPSDPGSLSANFIRDMVEDDQGCLWLVVYPGVNKFDPKTERTTRYLHDPNNPNSLSGHAVWSIARDSHGYLWFGTADTGLDRFDPSKGAFAHYRKDSNGEPLGWITRVIEDRHRQIWFAGERGLFHLDVQTGRITRASEKMRALSADDLWEDNAGDFWMLAWSPAVGLVKYERRAARFTEYPLGGASARVDTGRLRADGENGFWVPSSLGVLYFDRRTERFTRLFRHDDTNPDSLSDNSVGPIYRDRAGLLWVGTQNGGLNILNFQQEQFGHYTHRAADPDSLSPGKVTAIYEDSNRVLWVGLFPRTLDRLDRKTARVVHYVPGRENKTLSRGRELNSIFKDSRGYLWIGGLGAGLDRFDERTGHFQHYSHKPGDPSSLMTDDVVSIYGDPNGQLWVGQFGGVSRFDPATGRFTNYRPGPPGSTSLAYTVSALHRDRSGTLWLGTWGGILSRFDENTNTFVNHEPDLHDPHRLQGGSIGAIHEDPAGMLWLASGQGVYRYNRQNETFTRYTETQGLPNVDVMGILEDREGRLWISTKKGISRYDPRTETFRNYDVSDGLPSNEFSRSCYQQGRDGEMLFCGSNGITAFFPEAIHDNPFVPPVVITSFKIFNEAVPIGAKTELRRAIPYVDSLTLSYRKNVFSFEFAALSYANSHKNRYRYKLENFDGRWNEVGSNQRLATYTNLDPGSYVFRVQGSNSDGVWNQAGMYLPIVITPPLWKTNWFRAVCAALLVSLSWAAYEFRVRQLRQEFRVASEARLNERMRIARELHDTLLQSVQGLMFSFQAVRNLLPGRVEDAIRTLDKAIRRGDEAIAEGRDAIHGLRTTPDLDNSLEHLLTLTGQELASSYASTDDSPGFLVTVKGLRQPLSPLLQDELYRISREILRNAFAHAQASHIEAELSYTDQYFRLGIRDDGRGMDRKVLDEGARQGHWGLPGARERAKRVGAQFNIRSEPGAGTEVELVIPARTAYGTGHRRERLRLFRKGKVEA